MKVAILGGSGLVGQTMLELLAGRSWVDSAPRLLVSSRSAGRRIPFRDEVLVCEQVTPESLADLDVLLCSAGKQAALQWAPVAAKGGALVVDNSSGFRRTLDVPLVVPEVNLPVGRLGEGEPGLIIANPNCSTIQIAMFAAPLDRALGIRELHATTFQAVSGAGQQALDQWRAQEKGMIAAEGGVFPRTMAHNVLPAIGMPTADGSFEEETKVERELRKILGRTSDLAVTCTAVRVPVDRGHSVAVRCLFRESVNMETVIATLESWPGLKVVSDPHSFATPLDVQGHCEVYVGRLRIDPGNTHGLLAWIVADNLLKGAAWNAVQIVESYLGFAGPLPVAPTP